MKTYPSVCLGRHVIYPCVRIPHLLEDEWLVWTLSHQVIVLETHMTPLGGIRNGAGASDVSLNVTIKTPASRIRGDVKIELIDSGS
jgi:hypothetical protein